MTLTAPKQKNRKLTFVQFERKQLLLDRCGFLHHVSVDFHGELFKQPFSIALQNFRDLQPNLLARNPNPIYDPAQVGIVHSY
jgi:hypothetical protein